MEREGISVEIIDLRSLSPFDWDAIAATVRKTNRVIVAYEDMLSWGYGAEIAARIGDQLFHELDAPVRRVAAMDTFCAYQPKLEDEILPQTSHLVAAIRELHRVLIRQNLTDVFLVLLAKRIFRLVGFLGLVGREARLMSAGI